ncbi:hypothetical protein [Amycolatopsis sp. CA-128772]|uniref:hypothetical protein n=1 Tax=Amycolatopsis sp. CA-128772 TaxID=2073159 RepID=UPI000CD0D056|nr:hypothetical protein [Amycolatopsis sp. CA-128772]
MSSSDGVTRFVTTVMGIVIGLTFLFGFGNVLALALRIGVPVYVAPLVAPAVDLTVLGLLVGTRHLALNGAPGQVVQPARRLLLAASAVTLALNIADPICANQWGKAAFDAVGPLLLIGWAEVGPDLLRALAIATQCAPAAPDDVKPAPGTCPDDLLSSGRAVSETSRDAMPDSADKQSDRPAFGLVDDDLLERARQEDVRHWDAHRRPISAETLRRKLRIGAARSRLLVASIRADSHGRSGQAEVAAQARA